LIFNVKSSSPAKIVEEDKEEPKIKLPVAPVEDDGMMHILPHPLPVIAQQTEEEKKAEAKKLALLKS